MEIRGAMSVVVDGLGLFASMFYVLQERRFSAALEAVTSAVVFITMAMVPCFLSIHTHARVSPAHVFF